ncbi:MAG: hypothetical protein NPIRA04_05530 [Nitrospirales bacterium]|nr:MAG: hypothetical protein NPIRA04_05530 [Nitrospirales bacterium]
MLFKTILLGILALLHPFEFSWAADSQSGIRSLANSPPEGMVLVPAGDGIGLWLGQMSIKWTIEQPFLIDQFEVTVEDYRNYLDPIGNVLKRDLAPAYFEQAEVSKHAKYPVVGVTWRQAMLYCRAVGKRLPTSAEWKMAAVRRGDEKVGSGGVAFLNLDELGKRQSSTEVELSTPFYVYRDGVRPVGSMSEDVSAHGAYDLAGSVSEWVQGGSKEFHTQEVIGPFSKRLGPNFFVRTEVLDHGGRFWLGFRCAKDVKK